jgi:xanthine dehydrogenase YagR molybdenum-binding subunit
MKFDTPAGPNPIDQLKVIGKAHDRVEGRLKVSGTATYAYEHKDVVKDVAYGYVVGAGIAKGRIASISIDEAKAAPGVLAVVTYENAGPLGKGEFYVQRFLAGPEVDHYHQVVAVVVAKTFEQARAASALVRIKYASDEGSFDLAGQWPTAPIAKQGPYGGPTETATGDFAAAFAAAPVKLDETYTTPDHAHAMMEPHTTLAAWDGDKLTCWTSIQQMNWATRDLAKTLGMPKQNVRLISPYIGGGFGGKGTVQSDLVMAALGARAAGRPVKLALQRTLMFNNTIHRPATMQRIQLGATRDGKITAVGHESLSGNLPGGRTEPATLSTRGIYAGANRMTRVRLAVLDLAEGNAMRAPGEAPGLMALEIAMDEMAEKLGMDPVQFRIINDIQVDPEKPERPFSIRQLVACLETGADRFGWSSRNAKPGQTRDGHWLVGMGMAGAIRGGPISKAGARIRLDKLGKIIVETDMTDIGTGSYTIVAQTAAEMMGVGIDGHHSQARRFQLP